MVKSHLEIAVSPRFNDHGKRYITTKQNPRGGGGGGVVGNEKIAPKLLTLFVQLLTC